MINLGMGAKHLGGENGHFAALDGNGLLAHVGAMNGFLALCCICREITS